MTSNKYRGLLIFALIIAITSCQDNSLQLATTEDPVEFLGIEKVKVTGERLIDYSFDGSEGDPIDFRIAVVWVANHVSQSQESVNSIFFGMQTIRAILNVQQCRGIRIYYALDDNGKRQLLLTGSDEKGNDIKSIFKMKGYRSGVELNNPNLGEPLSSNEGQPLSVEESSRWLNKYQIENPSGLIAHFFGSEILNQILNEKNCIGIRLYFAQNDLGIQQILLVGVDNLGRNILPNSKLGGRMTEDDGDNIIADVSFPCPTYCSETE